MGLFRKTPPAERPSVPTSPPVDLAAFPDTVYGRADALRAALESDLAQPAKFGQPFGPGFGLEEVAGWVGQLLPEALELQVVGARAADAIGEAIRSKKTTFDAYDRALGVDEDSARRFRLSNREALANLDAVEESKMLMTAITLGKMEQLARWHNDLVFGQRMTAYFQLAALRMISRGEPIEY